MMTFYMTDFLCWQFDAFFMKPLGLDRHPELAKDYFGNYERLVYLAQTDDPALEAVAVKAAKDAWLTRLQKAPDRLWRPYPCARRRSENHRRAGIPASTVAPSNRFPDDPEIRAYLHASRMHDRRRRRRRCDGQDHHACRPRPAGQIRCSSSGCVSGSESRRSAGLCRADRDISEAAIELLGFRDDRRLAMPDDEVGRPFRTFFTSSAGSPTTAPDGCWRSRADRKRQKDDSTP